MKWWPADGAFASDRFCLGTYTLNGHSLRADLVTEWHYIQDPKHYLANGRCIDQAEIRALTDCTRAFLLVNPQQSVRVHVGWCENDYQIDMATTEGRSLDISFHDLQFSTLWFPPLSLR